MKLVFRLFCVIFLACTWCGCAAVQRARGLPPQEEREHARTEPMVAKQPLTPEAEAENKPKPLLVDPGFDGINTNSTQAEHDALLARKKRNVFSLKGEDKPIRSIKGSNSVESEELGKIYDDLEKGRNTGHDVFKFY